MMGLKFSDNATAALQTTMTVGTNVFSIEAGKGALYPVVDGAVGADHFVVTLEDAAGNREFIKVVHHPNGSDTFGSVAYPCVRGHYGSTPRAWQIGDLVDVRWSAGNAQDLADQVAAQGTAASISVTPFPGVASTNVQDALEEIVAATSVDNSVIMAIALG